MGLPDILHPFLLSVIPILVALDAPGARRMPYIPENRGVTQT